MQQELTREEKARNLGFQSVEDAATRLGYDAGYKHDKAHPKPYRLSVKATAEILATELNIYPDMQSAFVDAYKKGCRFARKGVKDASIRGNVQIL